MSRAVVLPAAGCFTGLMFLGATGCGKTSAGMQPIAKQIFRWRKDSPEERIGGLVLEVKGNFCDEVHRILYEAGREDDYLEIGLSRNWSYNPLDSSLRPDELAFGIGALIDQATGKPEPNPFWRKAYSNVIKLAIETCRLADDYVTFRDIYRMLLSNDVMAEKLEEAEGRIVGTKTCHVTREAYLRRDKTLKKKGAEWAPYFGKYVAPWSKELEDYLPKSDMKKGVDYWIETSRQVDPDKAEQFESLKFAVEEGWWKLQDQQRSWIIESCRFALNIFDEKAIKRNFCPEKGDPNKLPAFAELIEAGKVVCVNFPTGSNASLARFMGTMAKLDFERAVIERLERGKPKRPVTFICDEYHMFASVGGNEPVGDEKCFALSRDALLIPVVGLQSFSSLQSQVGDHWRSIAQHFRSKIIMSSTDDFTAGVCESLCGKEWRWQSGYSLGESGQNAQADPVTGAVDASKHGISIGTSYSWQLVPRITAKELSELPNHTAVALIYDGWRQLPPCKIHLKPHYLGFEEWRERRAANAAY